MNFQFHKVAKQPEWSKFVQLAVRCILFLFVAGIPTAAESQLTYVTNSDSTITITGYNGSNDVVIIPSTIDGLAVNSIGDLAFRGCSWLTNITIPFGIQSIGLAALSYTSITNVIVPDSVVTIAPDAFYYCQNLTSITISTNVKSIKSETFQFCGNLKSIVIPNGVNSIQERAFEGCGSLQSIILPESLETIGGNAFYYCTVLTNVSIPNNVTTIGGSAFGYCTRLANITLPNNITTIQSSEFYACYNLTSLTLPASVTAIGDYAFCGCEFTNINLPSGISSIGWAAFYACENLAHITIPMGITSISPWAFESCQSLTNVVIPDSVTGIGNGAFSYCSTLTSIHIPKSVNGIGYEAFAYGSDLLDLFFDGDAPSCSDWSFYATPAVAHYLPGTSGWDTFGFCPTAPWLLANPAILSFEPTFGIRANLFGFTISWATNLSIIVDACSDLTSTNWTPVATNALLNGVSYFSDPQWTNYSSRFYRVRMP